VFSEGGHIGVKYQTLERRRDFVRRILPFKDRFRDERELAREVSFCCREDHNELELEEFMGRVKPRMLREEVIGGELEREGNDRGEKGYKEDF